MKALIAIAISLLPGAAWAEEVKLTPEQARLWPSIQRLCQLEADSDPTVGYFGRIAAKGRCEREALKKASAEQLQSYATIARSLATQKTCATEGTEMTRALIAIAVMLLLGVAWAIETETQTISFEGCLETIRRVSAQYDVAPTNIAETNDLRVVKWFLPDGNVMVACSRADQKMVVTKTTN